MRSCLSDNRAIYLPSTGLNPFIILVISALLILGTAGNGFTEEPDRAVLLSREGLRLDIGGEVLIEYVDTENDINTSEPEGHFRVEFIMLAPKITLANNISAESEIEFETSGEILLNELYITFKKLPLNSFLKAGLEDRFIKVSRKTETYPLIATAFWRDDDVGLTWGGEHEALYWRLSLTNGNRLADKQVSRDSSYPMLKDGRSNTSKSQTKEIGAGIGTKYNLTDMQQINALGFIFTGKLSEEDISKLQGIPGYGTSDNDASYFGGISLEYNNGPFNLFTQGIAAIDGDLRRSGWYAQPSWTISMKERQSFNKFLLLGRYDKLNVGLPHTFSESLSWDREKITLAVLTEIVPQLTLKTEYYINNEKTGGRSVNNDELLLQLYIEF